MSFLHFGSCRFSREAGGSIGGWWVRGAHQASQGRQGNAGKRDLHSAEVAFGFRRGGAEEVRGGNPKGLRQVKGSGLHHLEVGRLRGSMG